MGSGFFKNPSRVEYVSNVILFQKNFLKQVSSCLSSCLSCVNFFNIKNIPGKSANVMKCFRGVNIIELAQVQGKKITQISALIEMDMVSLAQNQAKELGIKCEVVENLVSLTFIDSLMRDTPGYTERMLKILGVAHVNIEIITSSKQSIVVFVKNKDLDIACQKIAKEFNLLK